MIKPILGIFLTLSFVCACGVDSVTVNCPDSGCVEVDSATTAKAIPEREAITISQPQTTEHSQVPNTSSAEPEISAPSAEEYEITFQFKVSIRTARADDYCPSTVNSIVWEKGLSGDRWTCFENGTWRAAALPQEPNAFRISDKAETSALKVSKEVFQLFSKNAGCKALNVRRLNCPVTDNYIEVFTSNVTAVDERAKQYFNVIWKVFYYPNLKSSKMGQITNIKVF